MMCTCLSTSFLNYWVWLCAQTRLQTDVGSGADPVELEAALQQLKVAHMKQNARTESGPEVHGIFLHPDLFLVWSKPH